MTARELSAAEPSGKQGKGNLKALGTCYARHNHRAGRYVQWVVLQVLALILLSIAMPLSASAAVVSPAVQTERSSATLISEVDAIVPGSSAFIAFRLELAPGWHTYWVNPGDSGMPTTLNWDLPPGVEAGPALWPAPVLIPYGPLVNYGHKQELWLLSELTVPADYDGNTIDISVNADWLVCEELCIPEEGRLSLTLPINAQSSGTGSSPDAGIDAARASLPVRASVEGLEAAHTDAGVAVSLPTGGQASEVTSLYFFPYDEGVVEPSQKQPFVKTASGHTLSIPVLSTSSDGSTRLHGVLAAEYEDGSRLALELDMPITAQAVGAEAFPVVGNVTEGQSGSSGLDSLTLPIAMLLGLLGGMILNLMPCVFPVVSMKALAFVQETDSARARRHGLFYGAGVVLSFWLLAGALLALRAGGSELGWGFQLQSPTVLVALAVVFFVLGLSFLGFLNFGSVLPSSVATVSFRSPGLNHLASGVLAVLVASPCTGPFMGAALGFAVTRSNYESFAVFTALGVGMALPYLLLSWFPFLRRLLPKPGPWMEVTRQIFAFPMFATVIWLLWVLGQQLSNDAIAYVLLGLLLISFGVWLSGTSGRKTAWFGKTVATVSALGLILVTYWGDDQVALEVSPIQAQNRTQASEPSFPALAWQEYSDEQMSALNAKGKTVFVDFTAAWCITCQYNKRMVLETDAVRDLFVRHDIALMRADWTRRDESITRALDKLGRSGVPVYLLQRPNFPPFLLPEILTKEMVREALEKQP